jgi:sugar O-acyltransferase (sialic acid O-acetyltransferase NeuD family)
MLTDIVLFGCGTYASMNWYVLSQDSPYRVAGFTADAEYCVSDTFHGLPLVPFADVAAHFPPEAHGMIVSLGYQGMNGLRLERLRQAREKGYQCVSYVSRLAHVAADVRIGANCMIHAGAVVGPFAEIGDNCILSAGCQVGGHAVLADHCFLASRSGVGEGARIGERSMLALNASVAPGIRVAPRCLVGAGAAVIADTTANGVYVGTPAMLLETPGQPA